MLKTSNVITTNGQGSATSGMFIDSPNIYIIYIYIYIYIANDIYLVTQTNDAVSASALFHVSRHLFLSPMAGEYKRMPLKCRTPLALSQPFHEYFCGISGFKDDQTKRMQKFGKKMRILALQQYQGIT